MRSVLILVAVAGISSPAYGQSFFYARLGHGVAATERLQSAPAIGFGIRTELDSVAVDASFFNYIVGNAYSSGTGVFSGSLLRLQVLRFFNADAERSAYAGGGMSWGVVSVGRRGSSFPNDEYRTGWDGSGLQGEATVGYEFFRNSALRMFVQTDVGLPLFKAVSQTYSFGRSSGSDRRYIPTAAVTFGIGWQRR